MEQAMSLVFDEKKCGSCPKYETCKRDGGPLEKIVRQAGYGDAEIESLKGLNANQQMDALLMLSLFGPAALPAVLKMAGLPVRPLPAVH
jgi:hypothetical protein